MTPRGPNSLRKVRILRVVLVFRFLFGVEVIQVAEELVEAVVGGQKLILVPQVILAELAGRVPLRLQQGGDGRVLLLQSEVGSRQADLGKPGSEHALPRDKGGSAGGAGLLPVVVGETSCLRWRCGRCWASGIPTRPLV